jgi:NAD-dependent deacetylase
VAALLEPARRVVLLTGAGMSQESGVPTFRDAQTGLWARYDPLELASPTAFRHHPARVFGWYMWRWTKVRSVEPHAGYRAVVQLARRFDDFQVVTQNVDGLHSRAGSDGVIELHGSLNAFRCLDGGHPFDPARLEGLVVGDDGAVDPPACDRCGSPIRPGVVWFGEMLPVDAVRRAWEAMQRCDAVLVVGTSSVVYPAAELPHVAKAHGAAVVEVNPEGTPLTVQADYSWPSSAAVALPALADRLGVPSSA